MKQVRLRLAGSVTGTLVAVIALQGCSGKSDPSETNFGAALSQFLEKKGALCLNTRQWPAELSEMDLRLQTSMPSGRAGQMAALEAAGLVRGEESEVDIMGVFGKSTGAKRKIKRYTLTDAAKPFARERQVDSIGLNGRKTETEVDLCWGHKALDRVVKWEGPMKLGDYQEANVHYTYKIDRLAPWAQRPDIQAAFPAVKALIDAAGKREDRHGVKLTSIGWEANGL